MYHPNLMDMMNIQGNNNYNDDGDDDDDDNIDIIIDIA